jgi:hypothetical protein
LNGWIAHWYLDQMSSRRLLEIYPSRICHQGQTIEDHKLVLREVLPWFYQAAWSSLEYR